MSEEGIFRVKENRPDLIVLDLMMPGVDGSEVIHHLKRSEETEDIPIIMVSAKKLTVGRNQVSKVQYREDHTVTKSVLFLLSLDTMKITHSSVTQVPWGFQG